MTQEKNPERLKVLARIDEYERKGWFSKDVEDDPPTIPLEADQIDYLRKKPLNYLKMLWVNHQARRFINLLIKKRQLVIKNVHGLDYFIQNRDKGMVLTCNHFNAFDNFAVYKVIEPYLHKKQLWKVIREGNYTSFPGVYGLFFKNCNTLPLSSRFSCMKKFMDAVDTLLKRGEKVLVYAEQGMWWNYRKPRPMTIGAFTFAAKNNAPVLPMFITMEDSDRLDQDGFPIQEYTVHISEPIYPSPELSAKEKAEMLRRKNYEVWKSIYEKTYGIPLEYLKPEQ